MFITTVQGAIAEDSNVVMTWPLLLERMAATQDTAANSAGQQFHVMLLAADLPLR